MICVIAPYLKLKEIADSLAPSFPVPVKSIVGDLGAGLVLARDAVAQESIIVSRGGTAKLIRETLNVDVIEIGVSQFDLLATLKPYIGSTRRVAVAGFRALTEHAENLCRILDIPAVFLPVDDEAEMPACIEKVGRMDVACLIGDMVAVRSAGSLGIPLALIESGSDAVAEAIDKAATIARGLMFRQASDLRMKAVLNTVREGIIAVDRAGIVTHINSMACDLLGPESVAGMAADSILPGNYVDRAMAERHEAFGMLIEIKGRRVALNVTPIVTRDSVEGAVVILQEVGKIQDMEKKVRRQLNAGGLIAKYRFEDMASHSPVMCSCLSVARQYARSASAILIYGETGTGKERLAQSIHNESSMRDGPFVAINCGALPPTLLESELFGYVEGAFTGAGRGGKTGLFELAHGGTIFLDEINELDVQLQGKLLRVIQEREVMRVGGVRVIPVTFRLIAASNIPLREEMERGRIRRDLYYRLNVLDIRLPPLRERPEDIAPLFENFVTECALRDGDSQPPSPPPEFFFEALRAHEWPGNVRELENVAEKWTVLKRLLDAEKAARLSIASFAGNTEGSVAVSEPKEAESILLPEAVSCSGSLDEITCRAVRAVLEEERGNISRAAKRLGIDRQTLRKKLDL
jgi:transcriptional regulator with PAS, ATPase and Fis domain